MFRTVAFRCGRYRQPAGGSANLLLWPASLAALGLSRLADRSATLGLCVGQLASAPGVHPPEISGVGSQLGFHLWAPSPLIWVSATGLQVTAGPAYPVFTVQGLRGEGRQKPRLLLRVLLLAAECLYFLFFFSRNSSYSSPLVQTSTWPLTHPSLALPKILQQTLFPSQGLQPP